MDSNSFCVHFMYIIKLVFKNSVTNYIEMKLYRYILVHNFSSNWNFKKNA